MLLLQITYTQCIRLYRVGQFYPTEGENNPVTSESKTSGPIRDVIKRNSPRYRKVLIRNTNNEVLFDNEDARYMTSRTKSKLDVLATLVKGTGNHIRVIKAWTDQVDNNERLSLHYEGIYFLSLSHLRPMFSLIDTSQLICCSNQLTGFYLNGIFAVKGLIRTLRDIFPHRADTHNFQIISGNYSLICQLCTKPAMMTDT